MLAKLSGKGSGYSLLAQIGMLLSLTCNKRCTSYSPPLFKANSLIMARMWILSLESLFVLLIASLLRHAPIHLAVVQIPPLHVLRHIRNRQARRKSRRRVESCSAADRDRRRYPALPLLSLAMSFADSCSAGELPL
ncbi:hypothetical protein KC338_g312 [Hortaea werneckii]|nr:hypothetical protein KC338_g312 [Hortaea werneckii]